MSDAGSLWQNYHEFQIQIRQLDHRYLAYHVGTGQTHLLNNQAYAILDYLNKTSVAKSIDDILMHMTEQFSDYERKDIDELLNALLKLHLINKIEPSPDQFVA